MIGFMVAGDKYEKLILRKLFCIFSVSGNIAMKLTCLCLWRANPGLDDFIFHQSRNTHVQSTILLLTLKVVCL